MLHWGADYETRKKGLCRLGVQGAWGAEAEGRGQQKAAQEGMGLLGIEQYFAL